MTPQKLGEAVVLELKTVFSNMDFKAADGGLASMNVFLHNIPEKTSKQDPYHCPHLIVHVGEISDDGEKRICDIAISNIMYCDDPDFQGEADVLHVLEMIYQHLCRKGAIEKYIHEYPIDYSVEDGVLNAPYFLGMLQTSYQIPRITKDDHEQFL